MPGLTLAHPMLVDALWPARGLGRAALLVLAGSAVLAFSARLQIPFWPVPMTMQTFAVLVLAMAYGSRLGTVTVAAYLAEGALGLPVFASGGGAAYFAGPTGGYLLGFLLAAGVVGALAERGWDRNVALTLLAMTLGSVLIFAAGVGWLAAFLGNAGEGGLANAVATGLVPFLPAAAFKIGLAAAVLPGIWKMLDRR